jgi:O-antigen ligase
MPSSINNQENSEVTHRLIKISVFILIAVPILFDFIFYGSNIARISRVIGAFVVLSICWARNDQLFSNRMGGELVIFLTSLLYVIGTFSAIINQGAITPNVISLLIFLLIAAGNQSNLLSIRAGIELSVKVLCVFSVVVIILKMNPRGIYLSATGYPVILPSTGIPGRNYGVMPHPNSLGQLAALSIIFVMFSHTKAKIKFNYALIALFCLLKSGSRTAISALLVIIIFYLILKLQSKQIINKRKFQFSEIIIFLSMAVGVAGIATFLLRINNLSPQALTGRVQIWQTANELFAERLILGLGWGWEGRAIDANLLSVWAVSAHNAVLEVLFSTGFTGLIIFLYLLSSSLVGFLRLDVLNRSLMIAMLMSGVNESILDLQYPNLTTFIFLFLVIASKGGIKKHV